MPNELLGDPNGLDPDAVGQYRCHDGHIQISTGAGWITSAWDNIPPHKVHTMITPATRLSLGKALQEKFGLGVLKAVV